MQQKDLKKEIKKRVPPTAWPFFLSLVLLALGLIIPGLYALALLGGFILLVYLIIWITWIVFQVKGY